MPAGIAGLLVRSLILLGDNNGGENLADDFWSCSN